MAVVMNEAPGHQPKPPIGFPVCQSFYDIPSMDVNYAKVETKLSATTPAPLTNPRCQGEYFYLYRRTTSNLL